MTKVYVAASSKKWATARLMMNTFRMHGYEITYDWTVDVEKYGPGSPDETPQEVMKNAAQNDLIGVVDAEVFVLLWTPEVYGAMVELGAALASNTRRIIIVPESTFKPRFSVFFSLAPIETMAGWELIHIIKHGSL